MRVKLIFIPCLGSIKKVAMTPDSQHIVAVDMDASIRILDFETGAVVHHVEDIYTGKITDNLQDF